MQLKLPFVSLQNFIDVNLVVIDNFRSRQHLVVSHFKSRYNINLTKVFLKYVFAIAVISIHLIIRLVSFCNSKRR